MRIWSTPQAVFDKLNEEFQFTTDVCADPDNAKCDDFFTRDRGLLEEWDGMCFLNPPYGRGGLIVPWLAKAHSVALHEQGSVVCLIPARTNPPWWHDYVMRATEIRFVRSKVSFIGVGETTTPFWGNAIVVFRGGKVGPIGSKWMAPISSWEQPKKLASPKEKSPHE